MIRPMAAAMPPSVIRLKFMPQSFITRMVNKTVTGITTVATNVVPQLRRNR